MADVQWFKVLTDIFSDDKIKIIQSMPEGDSLLVMWFKVLSQAGKTNDGGYIYLRKNIPYTPAMLATLFNKPQMMIELALKTFEQFEMIDIDDSGYLFVTNWEKHQSIDALEKIKEQTRLRVQNHRDKKKQELLESNVTETLQKRSSNAIDKELELDKELDKELKNKRSKEVKKEYADYVFLTETEFDKLTELLGITERDNFFLRYASWISGQTERVQKNRSAYLTILNWHRDDAKKSAFKTNTRNKPKIPTFKETEQDEPLSAEELEEIKKNMREFGKGA